MILLIDASNILAGGGLNHLVVVLKKGDPLRHGFDKVIVCAPATTLSKIESKSWLEKKSHAFLNKNYFFKWRWRREILPKLLKSNDAFLFCIGTIRPPFQWRYVTICQNLLPIEMQELLRFGFSLVTLRLLLLRIIHFNSYKNALGVIFLTKYCYNVLPEHLKSSIKNYAVIPHGLNSELFFQSGKARKLSNDEPFKLLYVSIINEYKHQDKVIGAVINLNRAGIKVKLSLVGPCKASSLKKLNRILMNNPDYAYAIDYCGSLPYEKVNRIYNTHDAFIFASTCETFGMIITEAMAAGLPIICSEKSSLPETVQDAAIYCNPLSVESIEQAIKSLIFNKSLQVELSKRSLNRAKEFDWEKCSEATFEFLRKAAILSKL